MPPIHHPSYYQIVMTLPIGSVWIDRAWAWVGMTGITIMPYHIWQAEFIVNYARDAVVGKIVANMHQCAFVCSPRFPVLALLNIQVLTDFATYGLIYNRLHIHYALLVTQCPHMVSSNWSKWQRHAYWTIGRIVYGRHNTNDDLLKVINPVSK